MFSAEASFMSRASNLFALSYLSKSGSRLTFAINSGLHQGLERLHEPCDQCMQPWFKSGSKREWWHRKSNRNKLFAESQNVIINAQALFIQLCKFAFMPFHLNLWIKRIIIRVGCGGLILWCCPWLWRREQWYTLTERDVTRRGEHRCTVGKRHAIKRGSRL